MLPSSNMIKFTYLFFGITFFCFFLIYFKSKDIISQSRILESIGNGMDQGIQAPVNFTDASDILRPYFQSKSSKNDEHVNIYTFSAVIIQEMNPDDNMTGKLSYAIHFSAWEDHHYMKGLLKCCYVWNDGHISEVIGPTKTYPFKSPSDGLKAVLYKCSLNNPLNLLGSYIVSNETQCEDMRHRSLTPLFPISAGNESLGVCLKILYGNVDPKLLVDWMEFYIEMKVDTVIVKTYEISEDAQRVLEYYVGEGLVDVLPFDKPLKANGWKPGHGLGYVQERVAMLDCHTRLRHHTYFTVLDLDEFLFPYQNTDIKHMMAKLRTMHPEEHGFRFKSEIYNKDLGTTVSNNGSDIVKYFQRLAPAVARPKYVAITSTMKDGRLYTHAFNMGTEKQFTVDGKFAAIKHYRRCYGDLKKMCKGPLYNDTSILTVVDQFKDRRDLVMKTLSIN